MMMIIWYYIIEFKMKYQIGTKSVYKINLYYNISIALLNVCKLRLYYIGITHILTEL